MHLIKPLIKTFNSLVPEHILLMAHSNMNHFIFVCVFSLKIEHECNDICCFHLLDV